MRISRLARLHVGQFGGDRLAGNHRTGLAQSCHKDGIACRNASFILHASVLGRDPGGVDNVLQTDRDAMHRTNRVTGLAVCVQHLCLLAQIVGVKPRPRLNLCLARLHPGNHGFGQFGGQNRPGRQPVAQLEDRQAQRRRQG